MDGLALILAVAWTIMGVLYGIRLWKLSTGRPVKVPSRHPRVAPVVLVLYLLAAAGWWLIGLGVFD